MLPNPDSVVEGEGLLNNKNAVKGIIPPKNPIAKSLMFLFMAFLICIFLCYKNNARILL